MNSSSIDRRRVLLGMCACAAPLAACATNPVTGANQLILFPESELLQASQAAWAEVTAENAQVADPRYVQRLERVGQRITQAAGAGGGWTYAVFDSDELNAFVLPSRQVGFYRGIMDLAETDDQLAAVLGHETAHVLARHAQERASQNALLSGGIQATGAVLGNSQYRTGIMRALGLGAQVGVALPFSREDELEADEYGLRFMARAGYDPNEAVLFWRRMQAANQSRPPELLSTHPSPDTRIRALEQMIATESYL